MFSIWRNLFVSVRVGWLSLVIAAAACLLTLRPAVTQPQGQPGSIHGNVVVIVPEPITILAIPHARRAALTPGTAIFVSDIQVVARNLSTRVVSPPVLTNAEGYFRTPDLPVGEYEVCVSAPGYASSCLDRTIPVTTPVVTIGPGDLGIRVGG